MLVDKIKERMVRAGQTSRGRRLTQLDLARIDEMFLGLEKGDPRAGPSKYWIELNKLNVSQMNEHGYDNFKRTIALNYFTWTKIFPWDSQILFLCAKLPFPTICYCALRSVTNSHRDYFTAFGWVQALAYNFLTRLLWEYLLRTNLPRELLDLREPAAGNPPLVEPRPGMPVSQDLANSILEYDGFRSAIGRRSTILELGAGYGRTAFATLSMHPEARYVVVDIPPALWVAERYLPSLFPGLRVFRYRDFERFEAIQAEFEQADLIFLLSTQIEKLPPESVDLIVNISSLHEMRPDQIAFYFMQFDRLLKLGGRFYSKQWRRTKVLFEEVSLMEESYPVPRDWITIFNRTPRVQTKFFEALYRKPPGRSHESQIIIR